MDRMATYFQKTISRQKNKTLEGYLQTEKQNFRGLSPDRKTQF